MKRNTIIYFALIIMTLSTIVVSILQRDGFENKLWTQNSVLLEAKFGLADLKEKEKIRLSTNGIKLPDSITIQLPSNTFILRMHSNVCLSCYAENLIKLQKLLSNKNKKLFVLGSYSFNSILEEEISIIKGENVASINIPNLQIIPADSLEQPYLFFLENHGKITHTHFFEKHEFELTQYYLEAIQRLIPNFSVHNDNQ